MGAKTCPKCSGRMAEGYTIDHDYSSRKVLQWADGTPVRSIWAGTKLKGKRPVDIAMYRCGRCGYLENYACKPYHKRPEDRPWSA